MNRGYLFILLATLFFSSMETALKTIAQDFHPLQLNCTRFLVGGLLLIPFALRGLRQHGTRADLRAWKGFAALGFLGLFVSMVLYQTSILYTPASVVSVLFSCNPVMVLVFACLFLRTAILPQHVAALALEVAGALVIIDPFHTRLDPMGVTLVLLSAALFALYAVLGKKQCAEYSGIAVTCFSCLAASAEMLAFITLSHAPFFDALLRSCGLESFAAVPLLDGYTWDNILMVVYVCVFVTGGGYAAYFMGMEATSPMQASLVFFFKPVLAPILAMFFLGEAIPWNMWAGIALILIASAVSMIPTLKTLSALAPLLTGRFIRPPRH
ncbi:DMT family transporter [uncultured Mailhella sp.]|uniref:DMT family transporter n=1 Tax=uncultured Mailhella sp. TaxID=1981031 RepID=UPI00261FC5B5|nr:DMT family transporter [uncultured Mailhella sp.]